MLLIRLAGGATSAAPLDFAYLYTLLKFYTKDKSKSFLKKTFLKPLTKGTEYDILSLQNEGKVGTPMKLVKQCYIHNYLLFDDTEKDILSKASNIVSLVQQHNHNTTLQADDYLDDLCSVIIANIAELLAKYCNEYPN